MKIHSINLKSLRNEEYYIFHCDITKLAQNNGFATSPLGQVANRYWDQLKNINTALEFIKKSAFTEQLNAADARRDDLFRGLSSQIQSELHHFTPSRKAAAQRVDVVFSHYGNVSELSRDQETGSLISLIGQLRTQCAADLLLLVLDPWLVELEKANNAYQTIEHSRDVELAGKTPLRMKEERLKMDECYTALMDAVKGCLAMSAADIFCAPFAPQANEVIDRYKALISQREAARKQDEPAPSLETAPGPSSLPG